MKLDSRIIEGKKPFDCTDAESEAAKSFIGKKGYFADHISEFKNISDLTESVLKDIVPENLDYEVYDAGCTYWQYFLPAEWVKEPEKKYRQYRPYSLNEFLERYKIGETVTFRFKKGEHVPEAECRVEYKRMITGYETLPEYRDKPGESSVLLGGCPPIGLARLFEFYELKNEYSVPTVWLPFGVIEDE